MRHESKATLFDRPELPRRQHPNLWVTAQEKGYANPRWATFKQQRDQAEPAPMRRRLARGTQAARATPEER